MIEEHAKNYRQLLATDVTVLPLIQNSEKLLKDGEQIAGLLTSIIQKFLTSFDLTSAPPQLRSKMQNSAEALVYYGLLTHFLLFSSDYRLKHQVDVERLYEEWIVKSLTANSTLRAYNENNQMVPNAIFDTVFNRDVEPLQKMLGIGWWRRSKNRSKYLNLFASGVLLGMLWDMTAKKLADNE